MARHGVTCLDDIKGDCRDSNPRIDRKFLRAAGETRGSRKKNMMFLDKYMARFTLVLA